MKNNSPFTVLLVALTFFLCSAGHAAAADSIRIGVYLPLTGQYAPYGQSEMEGIRLAHKLMPTVLDTPIELVVADNRSIKPETVNAVKRLVEHEKVSALIGTYGSALAIVGAEIAEKARIPGIGTTCTHPLVTLGKKYYFRAVFNDTTQGTAIAAYAYDIMNLKKAAVLVDGGNEYSTGLADVFVNAFQNLGGSVVANLTYKSGDWEFKKQISDLIAQSPDIVFIPAYFPEGAYILVQAHELGAPFRMIGGDAMFTPDSVKLVGPAIDGFTHTIFPYDPLMPDMNIEAKRFTKAWEQMYPDKKSSMYGAVGYNAYLLIRDAIARAKSSEPEAIARALAETRNLHTPLGLLSINSAHDAEMPVGFVEFKDGQRYYAGEITPKLTGGK